MTSYTYTAVSDSGQTVEGKLQAESVEALRWSLIEKGLQPQVVREEEVSVMSESTSWRSARSLHLELSFRQIAVMLRSGLTLLAAVETVIEQPPSRATKRVYEGVRQRLENGDSFADALAAQKSFSSAVIALINMGEESGNLDMVIERAARSMEEKRRSKTATLTALFYPCFTFVFAVGVCVYMILGVIPPMKKALEALGRPLPAMTQSLIDVGDFFIAWGLFIATMIVLGTITLILMYLWPPGRLAIDQFLLRVPLIGTILRTSSTALFSRSMGTLINSGIPLVEGLRIVGTIHGNHYFREVVESARRRILEGGSLAQSLSANTAYTPMMLKMLSVGETSGNLEETLEHVADFHEDRLQALIKRLSAMLEPMVIIFVGAVVGYVYIAFFIAIGGVA